MQVSVLAESNFHDATSVFVFPGGGVTIGFDGLLKPAQLQSAV
jgi:hypothetical protein